jgi:RNA-binding protein NOB1
VGLFLLKHTTLKFNKETRRLTTEMSWAAIAKKGQAFEQSATTAQIVVATAEDDDVQASPIIDMENAHRRSVLDLPPFQKGLLVLDANAFIKGLDNILDVADCIVTISQVVNEVRDRSARSILERLPLKLHVLEPSIESIHDVMTMAAKTGDDGTMSRTDVRLCALALDCCMSNGCLGARIEPRAPTLNPNSKDIKTIDDEMDEDAFDEEDEEEGEEDEEEGDVPEVEAEAKPTIIDSAATVPTTVPATVTTTDVVPETTDDCDDDDGEWITPENIAKVQHGTAVQNGATDFTGGVACVTSDFAMQNTLMHLGVPIVGPRGMRIRELRLWLLRCHACFRIVTDTTKQFCPDCGSGDTLRRVNYVVHENGEKELFINFSRRISTRGTVFGLPKPRGGRKGTNRTLVLREDQLAHVMRGKQSAGSKEAKLQDCLADDDDELAVFGMADKRRKFDINAPKENSSYKRYNVNERKKARAGRRK